jgi:hypothetical protein
MVTRGDFSLFSFSVSEPPKELASHSVGKTPSAVHTTVGMVVLSLEQGVKLSLVVL